MDPLSCVASSVGLADVAAHLAVRCLKLYEFWESLQEAPATLQVIKTDLILLNNILEYLSEKVELAPPVSAALESCQSRVKMLETIVSRFNVPAVINAPKHRHLWKKFRMSNKIKRLEEFRKGVDELRATLMLGLMHQSIRRPGLSSSEHDVFVLRVTPSCISKTEGQFQDLINSRAISSLLNEWNEAMEDVSSFKITFPNSTSLVQQYGSPSASSIAPGTTTPKLLRRPLHSHTEDLFGKGTTERVVDISLPRAVRPEALSPRSSTGHEYTVKTMLPLEDGKIRSKQSDSTTNIDVSPVRYSRLWYKQYSVNILVGSLWIRRSTPKVEQASNSSTSRLEVIECFGFYPAAWVSRLGLWHGVEANLHWASTAGWKFNISVITAVPEDALIFDFCREGNIGGTIRLLERGEASVRDTTPRGWTPLHFAAAYGHVELCAALISVGADKQALVYEGPTKDALTPIAIWSERSHTMTSTQKINMMRLFGSECLDISEASGDGWLVSHNISSSMGQEKCRMSETSIHWLYNQKQTDVLISFSPNTVWHAIQQAVRGFLGEEYDSQIAADFLDANKHRDDSSYLSRANAIGHWLALFASRRYFMPLVIKAAQLLQIDGFDPIPPAERAKKRDASRLLRVIYSTWAGMSSKILGNAEVILRSELDFVLKDLCLDLDRLSERLQSSPEDHDASAAKSHAKCTDCSDDYTNFAIGLVEPSRVAFHECALTNHRYNCTCTTDVDTCGMAHSPHPSAARRELRRQAMNGALNKDRGHNIKKLCDHYDQANAHDSCPTDPFYNTAVMLYRSQGRRWIGEYTQCELLCATCFLKREEYIGKDSLGRFTRYTPAPSFYVSTCSVDAPQPSYYT